MYVDNCDTGSQPRKAISHIFGRNKLCTRMIPPDVWVHFCRKHYQRSRYRNAQEYAKVQCELVAQQVCFLDEWSVRNALLGRGGVVKDWTLSMRKREQARVQEKSKKRRAPGQDSDEEDKVDRAILNGTAVPEWLRNKVGEGYTTAEIQDIIARLKDEVQQKNLAQIPDIEILPNITDYEGSKNKGTLKRKASTGSSHRRSHSLGATLRPESHTTIRSVQPDADGSDDAPRSPPARKRQRTGNAPPSIERSSFKLPDQSEHAHASAVPRPITPIRQHPIPVGSRESPLLNTHAVGNDRDQYSNYSMPLLPTPVPQRVQYNHQALSPHLEPYPVSPHYSDFRRSPHVRSHSDVYQNPNYSSYSSSEYQSYPQGYEAPPSDYERRYPTHSTNFSHSTRPSLYYPQYQQSQNSIPPMRSYDSQFWTSPLPGHSSSAPRHGRHQSSPTIQHSIPVPPVPEYNVTSSRAAGGYEHQPYDRRQDPLTSQRYHNYRPVVEESPKTKSLYSERR